MLFYFFFVIFIEHKIFVFFFFQAEDGIRDKLVTGVQTCALPILVDRLKNNTAQPTADEIKFVRNGKAELQIWLTEKSPEVLAQLKQLGFEIVLDPKTAKMIIGRLAIDKLAELAEL